MPDLSSVVIRPRRPHNPGMTVTPEGYLALAYGLTGPLAWAFFTFVAIKGRARLAIRLKPTPVIENPPRVSVIVPCRNEAAGIEACLNSILASDYPDFELIAVNDRSDDGTGGVIDRMAAADPRLKVLHVRDGELPAGWFGKSNAVVRGTALATGSWLLFIDSDCTIAPTAIREAIATGVKRDFELVSFVPRFVGTGFWDSLMTPLCGMSTGGMYSMHWANARMRPQTAFACGQFICVRRDAYEQVGGHEALRTVVGEDVELARRFKRAGLSPRLGWGMDLVTTRMYSTLPTIWQGWGRNFIAASAGSPWRVIGAIAFLLCCTLTVWPALFAVVWNDKLLDRGVWLALAAMHYAFITAAMVDGYRWGKNDVRYALLWPVGSVVLLAIFCKSVYLCTQRHVTWRGVRYAIKPAEASPS